VFVCSCVCKCVCEGWRGGRGEGEDQRQPVPLRVAAVAEVRFAAHARQLTVGSASARVSLVGPVINSIVCVRLCVRCVCTHRVHACTCCGWSDAIVRRPQHR
jgi:hypothetical protein